MCIYDSMFVPGAAIVVKFKMKIKIKMKIKLEITVRMISENEIK